jgi:hypothetical protein
LFFAVVALLLLCAAASSSSMAQEKSFPQTAGVDDSHAATAPDPAAIKAAFDAYKEKL